MAEGARLRIGNATWYAFNNTQFVGPHWQIVQLTWHKYKEQIRRCVITAFKKAITLFQREVDSHIH